MMKKQNLVQILVLLLVLVIPACSSKPDSAASESITQGNDTGLSEFLGWVDVQLTDVQTGETFTMTDFSGKVVLIETMAMWCPNCIVQANEVKKLHNLLENSEDLVSVSLDVDVNEDAASLKDYSEGYGFEWRFAIAPLEVARALGNLYSAEYLNPPISPMLLIDRNGVVHELPYGRKNADKLLEILQPFLDEN
jgi:cytochrome oxidase Cu insertion factor (SCO1/SenC/PrrC family)